MKRIILLLTLALAVGGATGAAFASTQRIADTCGTNSYGTYCKYVDNATWGAGAGANSSWDYWKTNEVWRPTGYQFVLAFTNSNGNQGSMGNSDQNPFKIEGTYGYDSGYAANASGVTVSPVTAQVYTYFLP
jgi:hypothetical protein